MLQQYGGTELIIVFILFLTVPADFIMDLIHLCQSDVGWKTILA
jgi:hypothetical protein